MGGFIRLHLWIETRRLTFNIVSPISSLLEIITVELNQLVRTDLALIKIYLRTNLLTLGKDCRTQIQGMSRLQYRACLGYNTKDV